MSGKSIKAFAPATVANVSCGFDVLGFAVENPGDEVELKLTNKPGVVIKKIEGDNGELPLDPKKNTVSLVIEKFLKDQNIDQGVEITLKKNMPLKSGMGSSAASSVVGIYALNELLGRPLERKDLLPYAMEGELLACGSAHADNVAPALLGGFVLVRSYDPLDVVKLPTPEKLWCTLVHPHIEVKTKDARSILKQNVSLSNAVVQWGNIAGLVTGILQSDYDLIGRSMNDVIVEPIRSILIPSFDEAKAAALEAGALGCSISGSGPSMFALSVGKETAEKAGDAVRQVFEEMNIECGVYVSKVNSEGPRILE